MNRRDCSGPNAPNGFNSSEIRKLLLLILFFVAGQELVPAILMVGRSLFAAATPYDTVCFHTASALFALAVGTMLSKTVARPHTLYLSWAQVILLILACNALLSIPWMHYDCYGAQFALVMEAFKGY